MKKALLLLSPFLVLPFLSRALKADFTADHFIGCAPQVVNFTNTSTGGSTYYWTFGNGYTSTLTSPSTTYLSTGTYTVKLVVTSSTGAKDSVSHTVNVYSNPSVSFTADTLVCAGKIAHFHDYSTLYSSGAGTYAWNFGNGDTSMHQNPDYTYYSSGYYTITLTATNSVGCPSSLRKTNYVHVVGLPVPNFSADSTILCGPSATAHFTDLTSDPYTPYTYVWRFGDGGTGSSSSPYHNYTSFGTYSVKLIITDNIGCSDSTIKTNYINLIADTASFSMSPSVGCIGVPISFSNTSKPSYTSSAWDFGDGGTGTGSPKTHAYTSAGTYTITLTSQYAHCVGVTTDTIVISAKPTAAFTDAPSAPCPAPTTVSFTNSSSGAVAYIWDFGDGGASGSASPNHTYNAKGFYTVQLIAINGSNCKDTVKKIREVKIYPLSILIKGNGVTSAVGGCAPYSVSFQAFAITDTGTIYTFAYPYSIASTKWYFGDGDSSTALTPGHTYTSTGTYTVKVIATTSNGCMDTANFTVHVGSIPSIDFSASPTTACAGQVITFTATGTGTGSSLTWSFGDAGDTSSHSGATVNYKYKFPGIHTVTLIADNNWCDTVVTKTNYITIDSGAGYFTTTYNCDSNLQIIYNSLRLGATSYKWYWGDGDSSTTAASNPTHNFPSAGNYTTTLITYSSNTGCRDTFARTFTVYNPQASFTPLNFACLGVNTTFMSTLTGQTPKPKDTIVHTSAYSWIFDGTLYHDTTQNISYRFNTTGNHYVKVLIYDLRNNATCRDTFSRTIVVSNPTAGFYATSVTGCAPFSATFIDTSTDIPTGTRIVSRAWAFGDGGTGTGSPVSHTYTTGGSYSVTLTVTDTAGCSNTTTKTSYITPHKPVPNFTISGIACQNTPYAFTNTSVGTSLSAKWYFGDGGTSTVYSPVHVYTSTGTYTVKLVVTDGSGCMDSITRASYINVRPQPDGDFTMDDSVSICPPLAVSFDDITPGAVAYDWDFGDYPGFSFSKSPKWSYLTSGNYKITEIVSNSYGCLDTVYKHAYLLGFAGAMSYTPLTGCNPHTVNFSSLVTTGVPDFIFDYGDGVVFGSSSPTSTHKYTRTGKFVPKIIFTNDSGCSASSYGIDTITIDSLAQQYVASPPPFCERGTYSFKDTSYAYYNDIVSRRWRFYDGHTAKGLTATDTFPGPGTYSVILIDSTALGCYDSVNQPFQIYYPPTIDAGPDTTICNGSDVRLNPSGGISYVWNASPTLTCSVCPNPTAAPSNKTTYYVTGTDIHGCKNDDSVTISVISKTPGHVDSSGGEICAGDIVQLKDSSVVGATYTWIPAAGLNDSHIPDPIARPDTTTHYIVIARLSTCIPDTGYATVIVHPVPVVVAGQDTTIIAGDYMRINAVGTEISRVRWTPADWLDCDTCLDPVSTPMRTIHYYVNVYSDFGCADSSDITIRVICDHSQVYMPNAFTPNGDGVNDKFYPRGKGLQIIRSFRIYNRWGQLIFARENISANDISNAWDGTFNGTPTTPDVFVYVVDAICDTGEPVSWKGDVSIIK